MRRKINALVASGLIFAMLAGGSNLTLASVQSASLPEGLTINPDEIEWVVKYHEAFDTQVEAPDEWVLDTYEDDAYDPIYGDTGAAHIASGSHNLIRDLDYFKAFRQSYTFGQDNWLTVETYGRGNLTDDAPREGGKFIMDGDGKAVMTARYHNDAAIIASTNPLPSTYRLEVTVTNIDVGGKQQDENGIDRVNQPWAEANTNPYITGFQGTRNNGYFDGTYISSPNSSYYSGFNSEPWGWADSRGQNGMYLLSIVDYGVPQPHNNTFIHHHRKVAVDTDNNGNWGSGDDGGWSFVYDANGVKQRDGSRYLNMLWVDAEWRSSWYGEGGNFYSYTSQGPEMGTTMLDKYKVGESYVVAIERTPESYTVEITGDFYYGGQTTYRHTKKHIGDETNMGKTTYHFNQTLEELGDFTPPNKELTYGDTETETWPEDAVYPDYFYFGIPHINYYAGTAEFSNLTLYVPKGSADDPAMNVTATVNVSGITLADKVYDGIQVTPDISGLTITALEDDEDLTELLAEDVTFTWYNAEDPDRALSIVPKAAGSYILKAAVDLVADSDTLYRGVQEIPFTIAKATVTITADNQTASTGAAEPAYSCTMTGLAEGESLAIQPTVAGVDVNMYLAGQYVISVSGAALPRRTADSYNDIVYMNGKLTVSGGYNGGYSGSGGGAVSPQAPTVSTVIDKATGVITATVTMPRNVTAGTAIIPVDNATPGMVALLVNDDGTEEIVRNSVVIKNGIAVPVTGNVTLKVVDNTKAFGDMGPDHWAADAVAFVSSRELFQGTGNDSFSPTLPMTRGMLMTVLARLDGEGTDTGSVWYGAGVAWAMKNGVSNGENPDDNATREELAMMLYLYAGKPDTKGSLAAFSDAGTVNAYADLPFRWAVEQGIINGKDDKTLDPMGEASRAEVAAMLERFVKALAGV